MGISSRRHKCKFFLLIIDLIMGTLFIGTSRKLPRWNAHIYGEPETGVMPRRPLSPLKTKPYQADNESARGHPTTSNSPY